MGGFFGGGTQTKQTSQQSQYPQVSPEQQAFTGSTWPVELAQVLQQFGLGTQGTQMLGQGITAAQPQLEQAYTPSEAELAYPGQVKSAYDPLSAALGSEAAGLMGPVPTSIIQPLAESYQQDVLPGISGAAIRAGAPGGSAEQDLVGRATEAYGRGATQALTSSAQSRATTGASLATQGAQAQLAGPQAETALSQTLRNLSVQKAGVPIQLGQQALTGAQGVPVFSTPFAPPGTVSTGTTRSATGPSTGSEIGSGVGSGLAIALAAVAAIALVASTARVKKGIEPLDRDEYAAALERLRMTPVARWHYNWEPDDREKHIGPILELSPEEWKWDKDHLSLLDYSGTLHAALKGLDREVTKLKEGRT